jgi:hypothetical protein
MNKPFIAIIFFAFLLSGCSLFESGDPLPTEYHGAKGVKVLIDDPKLRNMEYSGLKKITVRSMSKAEFNNLQMGESITKIHKKFGIGIPVGLFDDLDENGKVHIVGVVDYPSVEFKGKQKIVLLYYDNVLDSKYFKPLNWKPSDFDSRYKDIIDDSKVKYY